MTVTQLKRQLEKIPPVGAINRARRREIIAMINMMTVGQG